MTAPVTLIATLGRLDRYRSARYRLGDVDLGEATVPATVLARHYRPERIILLCPGEAAETAQWFADELEPLGLPKPIAHPVPIPHDAEDIPALIDALAVRIEEETREGRSVHLDFSFGLRAITVLALLTTDLLVAVSHGEIVRITCINFEAPRTPEDPAEILDATSYLHLGRLRSALAALESRGDIVLLAETIAKAFPGTLADDDLKMAHDMARRLALLRTRQATSKSQGRLLIRRMICTLDDRAQQLPLLRGIAKRVHDHLSPLDPGNRHSLSPFALSALARWYLEHQQPALALILCVEASSFLKELPLDWPVRAKLDAFFRMEKKARNTLAHADLAATSGSGNIQLSDIQRIVEGFKDLCIELEDAHPDGSFDQLLPS